MTGLFYNFDAILIICNIIWEGGDDFTSIVTGLSTYFDAIILNIKNTTQLHSSRKPRTPTYVAAQPWQ